MYVIKARRHGCVRNDSETHETGITWLHSRLRRSCNPVTQSRVFHCHFAQTRAFSLYSLIVCAIIFSYDQAALKTLISVCLSVCLSLCLSVSLPLCLSVCLSVCPSVTPFWQCSCHHITMKFSGIITIDRQNVHAKDQGERSRPQRSWPHSAVSGP